MTTVLLITFVLFAVTMVIMGIGYIARGKCLSPSCGGVVGEDGEMHCPTCGRGDQAPKANQES